MRYRLGTGGRSRYRYGPGVVRLDDALAGPVPWRSPECARAATVHLGGTFSEIAVARPRSRGGGPGPPYVLVAQQSLFDVTRAPAGKQTSWAYTHVPKDQRLTYAAATAIEGPASSVSRPASGSSSLPEYLGPRGPRGSQRQLRRG